MSTFDDANAQSCMAGLAWRDASAANMALLCLNRFLDVAEAIEEGEAEEVVLVVIAGVDLPGRARVPQQPSVSPEQLHAVCSAGINTSAESATQCAAASGLLEG
jgi:hypothetical protein